MARIQVRFLIDANGILNVTAKDLRTGKEQSMDVKPSYGLSDEQVEAMILESTIRPKRISRSARYAKPALKPMQSSVLLKRVARTMLTQP
jgi:molecular chaperone DnaK (HSP70)